MTIHLSNRIGDFIQMYNLRMKALVENEKIIITDYTQVEQQLLVKTLSYTDKAKQYQLRRLSKNPFNKKKPFYKKLESEVHGSLAIHHPDGSLEIPSGFFHLIRNAEITDNRKDTGVKIALPWKKKPHDMRDYQEEAVDLMQANWRGLINFATGLGKTLTAVHAIRKFNKRTLIICPSQGIAVNFYNELVSAFGSDKVGFFGDGKKQIKDITVGIAQSVNNHIDKFKKHDLGLIIVDEVHHLPADTFFTIAKELSSVGRVFGLTATDFRSDGKDVMITAGVGDVLICRDLIWGIANKWLAEPYFIVRRIPTIGRNFKDDKNKNYKEHVLNNDLLTDQVIADVQKFISKGMSVLCLVDEIEHGQKIANAVGLPFANGKDKGSDELIIQLNDAKIPGLIGTDSKIGEGCDTKNVDVLILANFVASKGPLWQNIGRGLRKQGTKTHVVVLDYSPEGSTMLARHAEQRIKLYQEITGNVRIIDA